MHLLLAPTLPGLDAAPVPTLPGLVNSRKTLTLPGSALDLPTFIWSPQHEETGSSSSCLLVQIRQLLV